MHHDTIFADPFIGKLYKHIENCYLNITSHPREETALHYRQHAADILPDSHGHSGSEHVLCLLLSHGKRHKSLIISDLFLLYSERTKRLAEEKGGDCQRERLRQLVCLHGQGRSEMNSASSYH